MFGQDKIPFKKFTERARKALARAQEEAQTHQHQFIGTEHLLLGLIDEGEGVGARALSNLVSLEQVRGAIEHIIGTGDHAVTGEVPLTRRAKYALQLATREAEMVKHSYFGTEHLLLGLLREGEGIAAKVLTSPPFGVTLQDARAQVLALLSQIPREARATGAKSNVIACRLADRDLDAIDALVEAGIRSTRSDAASWLIHAGIEAHRPLFERVNATIAEIRQLRAEAQKIAWQVTGEVGPEDGAVEEPLES